MKVSYWKAWYTEGRVFCSRDTEWKDLPDDGVLIVKIYFDQIGPNGRPLSRIMEGTHLYFYVPGTPETEIYAHNNDGVKRNLKRYPGAQIKMGMWTSEYEMYKVHEEAMDPQDDCECGG